MKGRRGGKTGEKQQLFNSTQQVAARICRDSVRATRLRPPKLSSLFPLESVAWYPSSAPLPPPRYEGAYCVAGATLSAERDFF